MSPLYRTQIDGLSIEEEEVRQIHAKEDGVGD
jgi:hypothetical protein